MKRAWAMAVTVVGMVCSTVHPQGKPGWIVGEVRFIGQAPAPRAPTAVKPVDARVCGSHMADESIVMDAAGGVQNAAVYLEDASPLLTGSGRDKSQNVRLSNRNCRFEPHVQTATAGSTLMVRNDDNILHNTHAYLNETITLFNLGLPFQGLEVPRPLSKPGIVSFKCDAGHTWMSGYVIVLPHEFHAVSDSSGKFRIENIPAGVYKLKVWHERLGSQTLDVQVRPSQETSVPVVFGK